MHKPSVSRMSLISSIAASIGMLGDIGKFSTAEVLRKHRGDAPPRMKWISGVYVPGGDRRNVEPTVTRNPKIRANVQMMFERWASAKAQRENMKRMQEIVP